MAATIVQSKVIRQDDGTNTVSTTLDSNFTPGNALIVATGWYGNPANTNSTLASVTDNKGHAFIRRGQMHRDPPQSASWAGDLWVEIHDCLNAPDPNPSTRITVTMTGANTNNSSRCFVVVMEVSGLEAYSRGSGYVSGGLGGDTVVTSMPELPSHPQWAVGVLGVLGANDDPIPAPSGWTLVAKHDATTGNPFIVGVVARRELTTTAAFNTTWHNANAEHGSGAVIASYTLGDSVVVEDEPVLSEAEVIGRTVSSATPSAILTYDDTGDPPPPAADPMNPFSSDSEWTTKIPPGATYHGGEYTAMLQQVQLGISHEHWAINVYYATVGDPVRTVEVKHVPDTGDWFATYYVDLHWPDGAVPNGNGTNDGHLCIPQPDGTVWDFWLGRWTGSMWTFASAIQYPLGATRGWRIKYENRHVGGHKTPRAVDVSLLGGLIRTGELTAGVIPHALAMAVPSPMIGRFKSRVYPADPISGFWDGRTDSTGPMVYSDRFAIPPDVNVNAIARFPGEAIVLKAAQDYGCFLVDVTGAGLSGTSSALYSEYPGAYAEIMSFGLRPSGGMSVLLSNLRHVRNWY